MINETEVISNRTYDVNQASLGIFTVSGFTLATSLGPSMFTLMHTQQLIKATLLVGDFDNAYLADFWTAGIGLDKDWVPYEYIPAFTVRK